MSNRHIHVLLVGFILSGLVSCASFDDSGGLTKAQLDISGNAKFSVVDQTNCQYDKRVSSVFSYCQNNTATCTSLFSRSVSTSKATSSFGSFMGTIDIEAPVTASNQTSSSACSTSALLNTMNENNIKLLCLEEGKYEAALQIYSDNTGIAAAGFCTYDKRVDAVVKFCGLHSDTCSVFLPNIWGSASTTKSIAVTAMTTMITTSDISSDWNSFYNRTDICTDDTKYSSVIQFYSNNTTLLDAFNYEGSECVSSL